MARSPLILLAAGLVLASTAYAADNEKDCIDKPATVQKARKQRPAVRAVRVAASAPVPAPVVTVVVPPAAPPVIGNCVNLASSHSGTLGMAWTDWQCVTMQKARVLQSLGKRDAAVALLCSDPQMRDALSSAGTECDVNSASNGVQ